jgi:hypothetical protein
MFLRRDFYIKKQLEENKRANDTIEIEQRIINKLKGRALEQLSMSRLKNREMQFHTVELFLLVAPKEEQEKFYQELWTGLQDIFNDEKAKKTVEEKWSHSLKSNVIGLFNKIALDFYCDGKAVRNIFAKLYADTIVKLMKEDRLSRI